MGRTPRWGEAEVKRGHRGWRVVIPWMDGRVMEYVYASKRQAEFHAAVFRLGPTWFPAPDRVRKASADVAPPTGDRPPLPAQ